MSNNNALSRVIHRTKIAFNDAKLYNNKKREHSAYIYLNSRIKKQALKSVAKELIIEGIRTELFVVDNDLFKIEPVFDNSGNYICEEIIFLGTRDGSCSIKTGPIRESTGIV